MGSAHDRPVPGGSDLPPTGAAGPGWPGDPGGWGDPGGSGAPPDRPGRRRRLGIAAGVVLLAAAAAAGALIAVRPAAPVTLTAAQVAARVDPAVVDITSTLGYQSSTSAGTGMVLTASGLVLTNNHVIKGATSITATDVGDHRTYRAVVVGYDERRDIAVLRLRDASGLATVTMGDSSSVGVGDKVVALGNADGKGGAPAMATGQVIALNQSITARDESSGTSEQLSGAILTDVAIKAGYSGGPLLDTAGQVIGMNTAGSVGDQTPSGQAQARAYAVPSDQAGPVADQITAGKASQTVHIGPTAFLGVALAPGASGSGAAVARVQAGSPADRAGLTAGDVITSLGGHAIASSSDVPDALVPRHPGDEVAVGWAGRDGRAHTATLILAVGPAG